MAYQFSKKRITLSLSNPYYEGKVYSTEGEAELVRQPIEWEGDRGDRWYTVQRGDTLERIADRFYEGQVENPAFYYWVIADANNIENPLNLEPLVNTEITIPNIIRFSVIRQQRIA